ncbi:MAG: DUF192 domain-containing protein [Thermoplasmatota archaeon]
MMSVYISTINTPVKYAQVIFYTNDEEASFLCEIADDDFARKNGLSGRKNLSQDQGMLFTYESSDLRVFHMRDMEFPLDVIFIDTNYMVINIVEANRSEENIKSNGLAKFVVEINKGISQRSGIVQGVMIDIKYI